MFALALLLYRRLFPELGRFPTPEDRREALRKAACEAGGARWFWIYVVLVTALLCCLPDAPWQQVQASWIAKLRIVSRVLLPLMMALFYIWTVRRGIRQSLRRQLVDQGIPICLSCGYDLTGNVSGRCPECGEVI